MSANFFPVDLLYTSILEWVNFLYARKNCYRRQSPLRLYRLQRQVFFFKNGVNKSIIFNSNLPISMKNLFPKVMHQRSLQLFRTMLLVMLTFFQGCKDPDIISEPPVLKQDERGADLQTLSSFLANLTGAPIDKIKYIQEEKKFVVDGDIEISRSSAEEYQNAEKAGRVSQRRMIWLLNDNVVQDIKVYISPAVTPGWKTAIRQAIVDWNEMEDTKVNFREILYDYNTDIVITTKYEAPNGSPRWLARQHFPDADGTTGGGMTLNTYYNGENMLPLTEKRTAIVHELGHAIGLSHTDKPVEGYVDYLVCNTPEMDETSVMNSNVDSWTGFTYYDITAAQVLYPAHTWNYFPGLATDVGAGYGVNKSLWIIGKTAVNGGYSIHSYNYATKTFTQVPGGAVRISVGANNVPWVVNNLGQIFKRVNSQWQQQPGTALDIAVAGEGAVYMVSTTPAPGGFAVKFWKDNQWKQMPGRGAMRIAVTPEGEPWAIDNTNKVLKRSGLSLVDAGNTGRDVAAGPNGSVFVIGLTPVPGGYSIKRYIFGCWSQISGGGVAISAHGNGAGPVVINSLGLVTEY